MPGEEYEIETRLVIDDSSLSRFVSNWTGAVDKIRRAAVEAGSGLSAGALPSAGAVGESQQQGAVGAITGARDQGLIGADAANRAIGILSQSFANLNRTILEAQTRIAGMAGAGQGRVPLAVREVDPTAATRLVPSVTSPAQQVQQIKQLAPIAANAATTGVRGQELLTTAVGIGALRSLDQAAEATRGIGGQVASAAALMSRPITNLADVRAKAVAAIPEVIPSTTGELGGSITNLADVRALREKVQSESRPADLGYDSVAMMAVDPWAGIGMMAGGGSGGAERRRMQDLVAQQGERITSFAQEATTTGGPFDMSSPDTRAAGRGAFGALRESTQRAVLGAGFSEPSTQAAQQKVVNSLNEAAAQINEWSTANYSGKGRPKDLALVAPMSAEDAGGLGVAGALKEQAATIAAETKSSMESAAELRAAKAEEKLALVAQAAQIREDIKTAGAAAREANVTQEQAARLAARQAAREAAGGEGGSGAPPGVRGLLSGFGLGGGGGGMGAALEFSFAFQMVRQGLGTITQFVENAEKLQQALVAVNQQLTNTGRGGQFTQVRSDIIAVANDVGVSGAQVAQVEQQFLGLYQSTAAASAATATAMQFAKTSGLDLNAGVQVLTATSIAFGVSVQDVTDKLTGLSQRFGVTQSDLGQGLSSFAPVAADAGLNMEQAGAILAATRQATGQSMQQISQGYDRLIPQLQNKGVQVVQLFQKAGGPAAGVVPTLEAQFGSGQTGQAILTMAQNYDLLGLKAKNSLTQLLGGPRFAQDLITLFGNNATLLNELAGGYNDAGKQASYFAQYQETVKQQLDRLSQSFKDLGEALLRAGFGDVFKDAAALVQVFLSAVTPLVELFSKLNSYSHDFLGQLIAISILLKGVSALPAVIGKVFGGVGAGAAVEAGGTGEIVAGVAGAGLLSKLAANPFTQASQAFKAARLGVAGEGLAAREAMGITATVGDQGASMFGASMAGAGAFLATPVIPIALAAIAGMAIKNDIDGYGKKITAYRKQLEGDIQDSIQKNTQAAEAQLTLDLAKQPGGPPAQVAPGGPSISQQLGNWLFNRHQETAAQVQADVARLKSPEYQPALAVAATVQALLDKNLVSDAKVSGTQAAKTPNWQPSMLIPFTEQDQRARLSEVIKGANQGNLKDAEALQKWLDQHRSDKKLGPVIAQMEKDYNDQIKKSADEAKASTATDAAQLDVSQLQAAYAQGQISLNDVLSGIQGQVGILQGMLGSVAVGSTAWNTLMTNIAQAQQAASTVITSTLTALQTFDSSVLQQGPEEQASQIEALLSGPLAIRLTKPDIDALRVKLEAAQNAVFADALARAGNLNELAAVANAGVPVDPATAFEMNTQAAATGQPLPFPDLAKLPDLNQLNKTLQQHGEAPITFAQELADYGAASPTGKGDVNTIVQSFSAKADQQVAQATAAGASATQIAAIRQQADQKTMDWLLQAQKADPNRAGIDAAIQHQWTQLANDQVNSAQAYVQYIQSVNGAFKALYAHDPLAGAAGDLATANKEVAATGRSLDQIKADMAAGTASAAEIQAFTDWATATNAGLDAFQTYLQGLDSVYKALYARDPITAAQKSLADTNLAIANLGTTGPALVQAVLSGKDKNTYDMQLAANYLSQTQGVADAQNAQVQAGYDLLISQANAASNPLAAAKDNAAKAQAAINALRKQGAPENSQAMLEAKKALVEANAQVVAAQNAQVQAQYDLAVAQANAAGNPVAAAAVNVAKMQAAVRALQAAGAPAAGQSMLTAQAALVNAQAAYVQQQITTGESLIQTDVDLHRITVGQAIERLKQLKQLATNQTQMDQIQLQIQQLQNQAGANLSFDISKISLPSLYEVRRLNATPAGVGYADNRTFSIQLNVNNQLDLASAANMLAQTVGISSSRFGVAPRTP